MLNDETMIIRTKAEDAKLARKRRRILGVPMVIAAPLAAVLAFAGVAVAAILFSMTGSVTAQADNGTTPTISAEAFSGKFHPGAERDLTFTVNNPNDFPVKVTQVKGSLGQLNDVCIKNLSTVFDATKTGTVAVEASAPANGSVKVTIPNAAKLSAEATTGCAFKLDLVVTGSGAGN